MWIHMFISLVGSAQAMSFPILRHSKSFQTSPMQPLLDPLDPAALYSICKNAIDTGDLACLNGGSLHALNDSSSNSCAYCDCPSGWLGADCSLCTATDACPTRTHVTTGEVLQPSFCSAPSLEPLEEEFSPEIGGKSFSCFCGGDDPTTQWVCGTAPGYNWQFALTRTLVGSKGSESGAEPSYSYSLAVEERGGMPSMDQGLRERYRFAYPQIWRGTFDGCRWHEAPCEAPLHVGDRCMLYECAGGAVQCPPEEVPKCPDWTPIPPYCGFVDNTTTKYWQHNCNPLTFPMDDLPIKMMCRMQPSDLGDFQCYFSQEDAMMGSLGMKCRTGSCLYSTPPPGPPSPAPAPTPPSFALRYPEIFTLTAIGTLFASALLLAGYLIHADLSSSTLKPPPSPQPPRHAPHMPRLPRQPTRVPTGPLHSPLLQFDHSAPEIEEGGGTGRADARARGGGGGGFSLEEVAVRPGSPGQAPEDEDEDALRESQRRDYARLESHFAPDFVTGAGRHWEETAAVPEPSTLTWEGLGYSVIDYKGDTKQVLRGVAGSARPGTITGIMGPSGAGKTSLLDLLAGRKAGAAEGTVRLNGRALTPDALRLRVGYVEQSDILPGTSTVLEHLLFHARLRMPGGREAEEGRVRRVWAVIEQLGLSKVAHSFIGSAWARGLSGGEKRRLSLACCLLTCPPILMLDEPTSGLDSTNATRIVTLLGDLAASGATVVLALHQPRPDMFRMISAVSLLARGRVVFHGPSDALPLYLRDVLVLPPPPAPEITYADHLLDVVIRAGEAEVERFVSLYATSTLRSNESAFEALTAASAANPALAVDPLPTFRPSHMQQLGPLALRQLRALYRHPLALLLNLTATAAVAVALGLVFWHTGVDTAGIQNRFGCLYFILVFLSLASLSSLPVWIEARGLFQRERAAGIVGAPAFLTTSLLFEALPLRILPPFLFALSTYWMVGLHPGSALAICRFLSTIVLANVTAAAFTAVIGAWVHSAVQGNIAASLLVLLFMLFGGFLLNKSSVPAALRFLSLLSYFNYAYEALAVNEFHGSPLEFIFTTPINSTKLPPLRTKGDGVLKTFGFDAARADLDQVALVILFLGATTAAYVALATADETAVQMRRRWIRIVGRFIFGAKEEDVSSSATAAARPDEDSGRPDAHPDSDSISLGGVAEGLFLTSPIGNGNGTETEFENGNGIDSGPRAPRAPIVLSFEDLSLVVPLASGKKRRILKGVTGVAMPPEESGGASARGRGAGGAGSMFAILGPSGAGKSTLLGILSGRVPQGRYEGTIRLNGHAVADATLRRAVGFVSQDDILPGTSTVLEHLLFHARLRMPGGPGPSEGYRRERVAEVIEQLGLSHVKHSLVGTALVRGLSGGELRRLSLACCLLTCPPILMLDEPTSGLDSTNATRIVTLLSEIAARGTTVVMAIHAPRSDLFRAMDRVLLLSSVGRPLYSGPVAAVPSFLASPLCPRGLALPPDCNPADFLLDLAIKSPEDHVRSLEHAYSVSEVRERDLAALDRLTTVIAARAPLPLPRHAPSTWTQLQCLCSRLTLQLWRDPLPAAINVVAAAVVATFLGLLYRHAGRDTSGIQNRIGSLFFVTLHLAFMALSSLPLWHQDRLLFLAEHAAGLYSTGAYFLATALFDFLPLRLLPPAFFAVVAYPMIGYNALLSRHLRFLMIVALANCAASASNMALGAAVDDLGAANLLGTLWMLVNILLGGFLLSRKLLPAWLEALSQVSYLRYAFDALLINEFHGASGFKFTAHVPKGVRPDQAPFVEVTGDEILETFGFDHSEGALWRDLGWLAGMTGVLLGLTFVLLQRRAVRLGS